MCPLHPSQSQRASPNHLQATSFQTKRVSFLAKIVLTTEAKSLSSPSPKTLNLRAHPKSPQRQRKSHLLKLQKQIKNLKRKKRSLRRVNLLFRSLWRAFRKRTKSPKSNLRRRKSVHRNFHTKRFKNRKTSLQVSILGQNPLPSPNQRDHKKRLTRANSNQQRPLKMSLFLRNLMSKSRRSNQLSLA